MRYLLPSYSAEEAAGILGASKDTLPDGLKWIYAPPFSIPLTPSSSLANLVPSLPDDPKTRFLAELVAESSQGFSPQKSKHHPGMSKKEKETAEEEEDRRIAESALSRVRTEEFWERMGFRQECSSGDVTGFFTLSVDSTLPSTETSAVTPIPGPGEKGYTTIDPNRVKTDLSPAILDRLHTALLNIDFGTRELALEGSVIWLRSVQAIVSDEVGEEGWKGCYGEVEGKVGSEVKIAEKRKEQVVTVLQARKKKK